jgi:Region found in RelA / SpoT proteins
MRCTPPFPAGTRRARWPTYRLSWLIPSAAVALPISGAQIDKLGVRLRDAATVDAGDLAQLQGLLLAYDEALKYTAVCLRSIGLDPTTRLKTSGTIIEKLRREDPITLRSIRDLAGARVVKPMTLSEQTHVRDQILALWPTAKVFDRREKPSFGYRAVHIVPRIDGCYVEIQLRTLYQDTWAQVAEMHGDWWGRAVRYGGLPVDPDLPSAPGQPMTRREACESWRRVSLQLAEIEVLEDARSRLEDTMGPEELAAVDERIEGVRSILRDFRATLKSDGTVSD